MKPKFLKSSYGPDVTKVVLDFRCVGDTVYNLVMSYMQCFYVQLNIHLSVLFEILLHVKKKVQLRPTR